jgi:hypothetical protein
MVTHEPIQRTCRECGAPFTITVDELRWRAELRDPAVSKSGKGRSLPWRCVRCRVARRRARLAAVDEGLHTELRCIDCRRTWVFGPARNVSRHLGWARPRRCRRALRSTGVAMRELPRVRVTPPGREAPPVDHHRRARLNWLYSASRANAAVLRNTPGALERVGLRLPPLPPAPRADSLWQIRFKSSCGY